MPIENIGKKWLLRNCIFLEMNEKQFELSRYELNRKPQELILDDTEIKVQRKSLNALLMCPICLDVLRNTMTTKECLHRFCSECITTALRSGNKECPTCRKVNDFFGSKFLISDFSVWFQEGRFATIPYLMHSLLNCTHQEKFMKKNKLNY